MRFTRPVLTAVLTLLLASSTHAFRPNSVPVCRTRPLGPSSSISMPEETTPLGNQNSNQNNDNDRNNPFNFVKATTTPSYLSRSNPAMGDAAFLRKRTTRLLQVTTNGYETTPMSKKMKVDRKTFNWLIDAWAFSGELDAADNAAALLLRMEELHERSESEASNNNSISISDNNSNNNSNNSNICPDVRSYTKVMNAISRSGRPDAGFLAEQLFAKMQTRYSSGKNMAVKPNSYTYTALMEAHANSGDAARAEDVLDMMIDAYTTKNQHHHSDHDATTSTTSTTIQPTARNFNACISAYAKMGQAMQAEAVFMKMEEHFEHDGNPEAEPNAFHYNSVITAWANCPEEGSAQRAAEVLDRMEYPTTVSYNAVIDAWAKSGVDDAAERAEELLRQMERLYATGANLDAKPNVRSFNSVINVWAKSKREDAAQKAEGVLYYMERLYEGGNEEVRPDVHSFCTVINAWARSQTHGKAERARTLFSEMIKLYHAGNPSLKPNVVAYNAVMNACAWTDGDATERTRALEIANGILKELEASPFGNPDQVTYGTFLKVCATQMADCDSRRTLVELLFRKCCRDGQVGNMVLSQLQQVVSDVEYHQITGRWPEVEVKMEELPPEWWCNVVEGKHRRRKRREEQ